MGWNPFKEAEKQAKRAVNKVINPAIDGAKHGINSLANDAKKGINKVKNDAENEVKKVGREIEGTANKAKNEIEGVANKAKEEIPELAEKALKEALQAATSDAVKRGLNTALDIIELCSPDTFSLFIGVELALVVQVEFKVQIDIPNPTSKLTEIRKWAKNAPKGRSQIIACVKDFGPESLTVEAGVSGNGGSATWSGATKYDKLDAFLKKQGV